MAVAAATGSGSLPGALIWSLALSGNARSYLEQYPTHVIALSLKTRHIKETGAAPKIKIN
jgi:hypothetical protein